MISEEVRALIISHLREGRKASEIVPLFSEFCGRSTVLHIASNFKAGKEEKPRKKQKQP